LKPWLQTTAKEYEGKVKFVAIDVDKAGDVAEEYKVQYMPTLVVVKGGEEVGRVVGASKDEIVSMIEDAL
jgi:thioredoxin 1